MSTKIIASAVSVLWLCSCGVPVGGDSESLGQGLSPERRPVELLYVRAATEVEYGASEAYGKMSGYIQVENIAFTKRVTVHYTTGWSGEWKDLPASYFMSLGEDQEVWYFESEGVAYSPRLSADFRFAVQYVVDGCEYWDNNHGQDYAISTGPRPTYPTDLVLGKSPLALSRSGYYAWNGDFAGDIVLRNVAYEKNVEVVYTIDNWQTWSTAQAMYFHPKTEDSELWSFTLPLGGYGYYPQVEFAIHYQADGLDYWDNNFYANYTYP
jgi:hypothetical protein